METQPVITTRRHVRVYIGLGIGVLIAAALGLIYAFGGS